MAPRDNQELVPLTDGSGRPNDDDELEGQRPQKRSAATCLDDNGGGGGGGKGQLQTATNDMKTSMLACQQVIGLGTLWRFPYVCLKYGGGTFLIPYMIIMCLVGYPLLIMEIGIGQKLRHNSITIWTTINPQLGGIGIVMCLVNIGMACYYGTIINWGTKYMIDMNKFPDLWPPHGQPSIDPKRSQSFWHKTVLNVTSSIDETSDIQTGQAFSLFFTWFSLALMLAAAWISCKNKYIQAFINYSNSMFQRLPFYIQIMTCAIPPFLLVVVYIVESGYGYISFLYITSVELKDLLVFPIWVDAVIQVFCSLGLVHGPWTSFGSSSKRKSNFLLTATVVVSFSFILVFVWTWFIVSTIIPNVLQDIKNCVIGSAYKWDNSKDMPAHVFYSNNYDALIASRKLDDTLMSFDVQECNMENQFKLASNGVGLMFIALGEFTTTFSFEKITGFNQTKFVINIPQILVLTIGTAWLIRVLSWFVWALTEVKCLKKLSTFCISSILCTICCICGLVFTTRTGVYWLSLYTEVFINPCLTVLALCEVLIIVFIYGYKQFLLDIYDMTGHTIGRLSIFIWRHVTPMLLILTFSSILTVGILDGFRYEVWTHRSNFLTKMRYPYWAQLIVWANTAVCLLLILAFCIVDSRQNLTFKFLETLNKAKKTTTGHMKRSDSGLSGKGIITEIDFDDCHDSENDEELDTSLAQAPVRMYKIEVLDSWKSARGQVYL
ncbi:unnamed protein product [Macrosiphum euphorbiae]|uniref:Transporter n=1 Tax=Macrosiphum euphorbiae TaxID=13131 RepID=A0AAV0VLN3_9HEMI|nr:unnamed protein product [Macrosiphum euphorbiae]